MDKSCDEALQAPIQRIFYLSAGGGPCRGLNQAGESSVLQYLGTAAVHCSPFHLPCCEEPPWHAVLNPALPTGRPRCVKQVVSAPLPSVAHGPPMAPPPAAEGDTHEHEVAPAPNPAVLTQLQRADAVIYGMGSLFTSILPSLVLRGVGECIAATNVPKVRPCRPWLGRGRVGAAKSFPCMPATRQGGARASRHAPGGNALAACWCWRRLRALRSCVPCVLRRLSPLASADLPPERRD